MFLRMVFIQYAPLLPDDEDWPLLKRQYGLSTPVFPSYELGKDVLAKRLEEVRDRVESPILRVFGTFEEAYPGEIPAYYVALGFTAPVRV
jgi:hypothetical protein